MGSILRDILFAIRALIRQEAESRALILGKLDAAAMAAGRDTIAILQGQTDLQTKLDQILNLMASPDKQIVGTVLTIREETKA